MAQKTGKYSLNGNVLLSTILASIGYKGINALSFCQIQNTTATPVYITLDDQNSVAPITPSNGISIGSAEESRSFSYRGLNPDHFLDAGTTWLNAGTATDIKITVIGGGI